MGSHPLVSSLLSFLLAFLGAGVAGGQEGSGDWIPNWPAPATWSAHSVSRGVSTMGSITSPFPFIGVTPCRILDTRNPAGPFGGPAFSSGETRTYTIPAGPCSGIPVAAAYSLNFTAVNMIGVGFLTAWPAGTAQPLVSTLDYAPVEGAIANAAIVPADSGGAISVYVALGTNVIIDINGYYAPAGVGNFNTFLGNDAGNFFMTGNQNTGIGASALVFNQSGSLNTAVGFEALLSNMSGFYNTAIGDAALLFNTTGNRNTAIGVSALENSTGNFNIAIGASAGLNQQTGSHDIYIGNAGVNGESNTIRIGDASFQDGGTIITGISGLTTIGGAPVYVNGGGRMGTSTSSSWHVKEDIRDIAGESDRLMKLRPVAFKYKPEFDPAGLTQYGLIAEEVAEIFPELATSDRQGRPEGVRYHLIAPLLLNEIQKQRRTIATQQTEIEDLKARLASLEARVSTEQRP